MATFANVGADRPRRQVIAPSGDQIIVSGSGGVSLVDLKTGTVRSLVKDHGDYHSCVQRDGKVVVVVSDHGLVQLLNLETDEEISRFVVEGPGFVLTAALSPDNKTLVTNGKGFEDLIACDMGPGHTQEKFGGEGQNTLHVRFSPDGRFLVTFGGHGTFAKLWSLPDYREQGMLSGHSAAILDAVFSPDSKTLATTSYDGIRLWEIPTGRPVAQLRGQIGPANCLAFSPDRRILAAGFGNPTKVFPGDPPRVELWDIGALKVIARWEMSGNGPVDGIAFSPDGTKLITVRGLGEVEVWDVGKEP